jgi:hypothetical protein
MSDSKSAVVRLREGALKDTYELMLQTRMNKLVLGFDGDDATKLEKWDDEYRCVPNAILRSALFGAIGRGPRANNKDMPVASLSGVTITHSGPQLDQADLDVWEQCLHMARETKLGSSFKVSVHPFLKAIGRATGKSQRDWLKESFERLLDSKIEVKDGSKYYSGHLLSEYARDEDTGLHYITINAHILELYGDGGWTLFEFKERLALRGHPLALWLHGFYITHAKAYPYKVETIHKLCGSKSNNLTDFRKDIRKAFMLLKSTFGWTGEINDKGHITVDRPISRPQQRNLISKMPKYRRSGFEDKM